MTTKEDLKTLVTVTASEDLELAKSVEDILANKGEIVAIVPFYGASGYRIVAKYPKRIPSEIIFNIHDLVKQLRAVPETRTPREQQSDQFTPRKHLRPETIKDREQLADVLNPGMPCAHLISASEMALILLRAYQAGTDKSPVHTDTTNGMIEDIVRLFGEYLIPWCEADVDASREAGTVEQGDDDVRRLVNLKKARDLLLAARK